MTIWMLLTLSCSGYSSATCSPNIEHYNTKQECISHIYTFKSGRTGHLVLTPDSVCIPVSEPGYPTEADRDTYEKEHP